MVMTTSQFSTQDRFKDDDGYADDDYGDDDDMDDEEKSAESENEKIINDLEKMDLPDGFNLDTPDSEIDGGSILEYLWVKMMIQITN